MPSILWNGQILNSDTPLVLPDSLTVRYGIGVFETIRCHHGELLFFQDHIERLSAALNTLTIPVLNTLCEKKLSEQIMHLLQHEALNNARVRLSVLSNGHTPPHCLITCSPLPEPFVKPLSIDFSAHYGVWASPVSGFKNINYLHYLLAADEAIQKGIDDVVLLNQHGRVCETSISNIFCRTGNTILTPALTEGCIAGIFRKQVLNTLQHLSYDVQEVPLSTHALLESDEIFLTNVIRGIRPVEFIRHNKKDTSLAQQLTQYFQKYYSE
ncbi:MAG TPA: aminotransferase class IV [Ferruginibacter sp.]|nr:aminotransferase class IV [Ferruginibacter sp.]HRO17362.1 aminotransferase class IV [Ferruginibacter sp.]HRQ21103.1 aminotransferase class IV [Ferruginibacter sp.]